MLSKALNNLILIKLKDTREFQGRLKAADNYMNLELNNATEHSPDGEPIAKYGEIFIRGNNILWIKIDATELVE